MTLDDMPEWFEHGTQWRRPHPDNSGYWCTVVFQSDPFQWRWVVWTEAIGGDGSGEYRRGTAYTVEQAKRLADRALVESFRLTKRPLLSDVQSSLDTLVATLGRL